ncbi:TNF receptor-associated factor 5-like [Nomia melanderi]|uniref:TNF receptor-associated factor 5-like n=1 Tax=Nomia melanderi TaxID=2448451 RepID=UPI003FCC5ABD
MSNRLDSVVRRSIPCYFCNEFLEERYLFEHVKHCGSVLEECPYGCRAYVTRKNMEEHRKSCDRNASRRSSRIPDNVQDSLWRNKVFSALTLLRSAIYNEERERRSLQDKLVGCMRLLHSQQETIDALRLRVTETRPDAALNERLSDLELSSDDIQRHTSIGFQQISEQLSLLHEELSAQRSRQDRVSSNYWTELKDLKSFLTEETARLTETWRKQQQLIHDLKLELEMRCKSSNEFAEQQKALAKKIDALEEEARRQSAIVSDQSIRVKGLKFQAKENLKYLEELIRDSAKLNPTEFLECTCERDQFPTNGRLLWRIDRYKEKMSDAKESECALYSPRFSNKEYGYTLRLELFLNGIGQWRGRHVIGCLRVENGEWDPLLDWPCILKATVILRNQENPANDVRKFVKTVGRDKTNPDSVNKESGVYMFIPHTTLTRYPGYIKDNVLFLDIQVRDIKTSVSTQSLLS